MHIGYATQDPSSHYWSIVNYGVQERAAESGHALTTLHAATLDQQRAALRTLREAGIDALLLGPVAASGLAGELAPFRAARIPIIVLAAEVTDAAATCTIRSDHRHGAELAARYVIEQIGGAGAVAHLIGPLVLKDNSDRAAAVRAVFGQTPGIEVVAEAESPDWNPGSGAAFMRRVLAEAPHVRGICVANDTLALGVADAIAEAGRTGSIVVTGFDATPEALIALHEGRLSATIRQSIRQIGRLAVDAAAGDGWDGGPPPQILTPISLITRENLLAETLESVYLLPLVLRDIVGRNEALAQAQAAIIQAQRETLRELSTPLIPISDYVMIMPLVGSIDDARSQQITQTLLLGIAQNRARVAILDITGVLVVDTQVADGLLQAAQAVKLLGAEVVLTGIRPEIAQTLVGLGVDLRGIVTESSLQRGIAYALGRI